MKTFTLKTALCASLIAAGLTLAGCASKPVATSRINGSYMQKNPVRVAIMPSFNKTNEAAAALHLDKAWEDALKARGFEVVNADTVVNLAASQGINLADFGEMKLVEYAGIGRDLEVDYILTNTVTEWSAKYRVVQSKTQVNFSSKLFEAKTGAVIWNDRKDIVDQSSSSGGNPIASLVGILAHAVVSSASNAEASLAKRGVTLASTTLPKAGYAPDKK